MPSISPYRALIPERRIALVTYVLRTARDSRERYIQRLVERGGGFRAASLRMWPIDRLAREVVRARAEDSTDELDLLQLLYVDLEPGIQITYLDEAGVKHDNGKIPEELDPPYADADSVRRAVHAVHAQHGAEGMHYLRTLVRYSPAGWPGIESVVSDLEPAAESDQTTAESD